MVAVLDDAAGKTQVENGKCDRCLSLVFTGYVKWLQFFKSLLIVLCRHCLAISENNIAVAVGGQIDGTTTDEETLEGLETCLSAP